jgi:hypothetical protein
MESPFAHRVGGEGEKYRLNLCFLGFYLEFTENSCNFAAHNEIVFQAV